MTRRSFALVLGAAPVAFSRSWEQPTFPNWSPEFVSRLLTDSPWARPVTIPFVFRPAGASSRPLVSEFSDIGLPRAANWPRGGSGNAGAPMGAGEGVRTEMNLIVRWSSALPIRQALALAEFGREGLDHPKALELLSGKQEEYVVEVAGIPTGMATRGARYLEAEFAESARVQLKGRRALTATSASVPEHGMHLIATLRFPRMDDLTANAGVLTFSAEAASARIEQAFKLREMTYGAELEL